MYKDKRSCDHLLRRIDKFRMREEMFINKLSFSLLFWNKLPILFCVISQSFQLWNLKVALYFENFVYRLLVACALSVFFWWRGQTAYGNECVRKGSTHRAV